MMDDGLSVYHRDQAVTVSTIHIVRVGRGMQRVRWFQAVVTPTPVTCDLGRDITWSVTRDMPLTIVDRQDGRTTKIQAVMPTATSVLRSSLEKHNETFENLLSLIPAKFYLARDDNNDQVGSIVSLSGHTYTAATGYI